MLAIAALLDPRGAAGPLAIRLIGAAPLAALMAAARVELGRERASSRVAAIPSAMQVRVERRR